MKSFFLIIFFISHVVGYAQMSPVLLNNKTGMIPVLSTQDMKIASIHFNYSSASAFDSIAKKYWMISSFNANGVKSDSAYYALHDRLALFNLLIIELSDATIFDRGLISFIKEEEANNAVVIVLAGDGKNLAELDDITSPVVWYNNDDPQGASVAAQVIFGGFAATGRLDHSFSKKFKKGKGFTTEKTRLGYSTPEAVRLANNFVSSIDSIAAAGIAGHYAPGLVTLLVKDGKVIFHKAYGKHSYSGSDSTRPDDIFDMASVTKVSATTTAIMRLYDEKRIDLEDTISKYVAVTRNIPDKVNIKIKEALLHEAGYTPYIKFYEQLRPLDLRPDSSEQYPTKVADHYYLRAHYFDEVMWPVTLQSPVLTRGKFVYSDVSMYMMKEVVENVTHQKLNDYVATEFYQPLGLQATGFLPRNRFDRSRIVPTTENDNWFRNVPVQGYVNDPGSAMAGGVEGHAGLFSIANDLAILWQMYLNKGSYAGHRYLKASTVELFTSRQSTTSHRGYGFDRVSEKQLNENKGFPSEQAFGHSGYTGTYVWVDPKYNMVYVCLTNRVYPDDGKTFGRAKVDLRLAILDLCYRAIISAAPCR